MTTPTVVTRRGPLRRRLPCRGAPSVAVSALAAAALAAMAFAAGCSGSTDPAERSTSTAAPTTAAPTTEPPTDRVQHRAVALEPAPCPDPTTPTDRFSCERLVVAEDPGAADGRQVELPVLALSPSGGPVGGTPVVYLHGGPGSSAVSRWATWLSLVDGLGRDVVLYDQRGGGSAVPRLDCPEHSDAIAEVLGADGGWEDDRELVGAALARCHARLVASGIDLDHYDTPTATADLEALRQSLEVEQVTLVASSYGSRLALDYLRAHPDRVESVVLDGVDPPGEGGPERDRLLLEEAIHRLVLACGRDPECARERPDLAATIDDAATRLDAAPGVLTVPGADGESSTTVRVGGDELLAGVFAALYDSSLIPLIPSAVSRLAAGDQSLLDTVGARLSLALDGGAMGAQMSINCADHGRAATEESDADELARSDPGRARLVVLTGSDGFCGDWPVSPVGAWFAELRPSPAELDVPMLVVVGELDPITPASAGAAVATDYGAALVEVARGGHSPLLTDSCAMAALSSFLADPEVGPPACERPPTPFA